MRVSLVIALFFVLLSVGFMTALAQTGTDWQKANGGWIVIKNNHQYDTGGPFQPCPGQTGCKGLSLHVEHGVCINAVTFANPTTGASWTPPKNNIILAQDCGTNDWMRVSCPVVTEYWVPAGTYTLTEFNYVSEVNTNTNYVPCDNAWSNPSKTVAIKAGDIVDFGDNILIGTGTCTVGGYSCPGGKLKTSCSEGECKTDDGKCYSEGTHTFSDGDWQCRQGKWSKAATAAGKFSKSFSGEAISEPKNGKTWPFKLTLIGPDADDKISGQIEWPSLDSIHQIEGHKTATGITFTETGYIKKGGAVLNCIYNLNSEGDSFTGTYGESGSCDDKDYGTISMRPE